jgi:hypothetical protein
MATAVDLMARNPGACARGYVLARLRRWQFVEKLSQYGHSEEPLATKNL